MDIFRNVKLFYKNESGLTIVEYVVGVGAMVIGFIGLILVFKDVFIAEFYSIFNE